MVTQAASRLGELLVKEALITPEVLDVAQARVRKTGEFLGAADSYDELANKVEPHAQRKVVGYERVIPRDAVILGGFGG